MTQPDPTRPPAGVHLPRPTIWPMVVASGIALILAGIVINLGFSVAGVIILVIAIGGWIREIRDE